VSGRGTDFFVSHAGRDTAWAEWLAWQLQQAGYTVELDVWDWAPGENFVARMQQALERADRLLAVCTEAYFASAFGGAELRAAFAGPAVAQGRIVPVLVEQITLPPLYATLIQIDLTGLDEAAAAARLRDRLTGGRPTGPPPFPRPGSAPMSADSRRSWPWSSSSRGVGRASRNARRGGATGRGRRGRVRGPASQPSRQVQPTAARA
jgi:TIR domain